MTIEFHCEHCNELIKAPVDASGRRGKCPHCGGKLYIPMLESEDEGELPLVPLDLEEERRRGEANREAMRLQRELLHEQAVPGERKKPERRGLQRSAATRPPATISTKELNRLIVQYVEAMAGGRLDRAGELTTRLSKHKSQALAILNGMETEDLTGYGLPTLPRPVLLGFLRQLRMELQRELA